MKHRKLYGLVALIMMLMATSIKTLAIANYPNQGEAPNNVENNVNNTKIDNQVDNSPKFINTGFEEPQVSGLPPEFPYFTPESQVPGWETSDSGESPQTAGKIEFQKVWTSMQPTLKPKEGKQYVDLTSYRR